MFTFFSTESDGLNLKNQKKEISWKPMEDISKLPMAAGDYHILEYMIHGNGIIYGTFTYTPISN